MQRLVDERAYLQERRRRIMARADVSTPRLDGMPHARHTGSVIEDSVCEASAVDARIAEIDEEIGARLKPLGWPLSALARLRYLEGYTVRQAAEALGYSYPYASKLLKGFEGQTDQGGTRNHNQLEYGA